MKKNKKKKYNNKPIVFLLIIIIIIVVVLMCYFFFKTDSINITTISKIDNYDYYLESNATKVYKNNYYELEDILSSDNVDEEKYAKTICKLFVIDFYTLTNKLSNQDIGGIQFVSKEVVSDFKRQATNTTYKYVKNNSSGRRKQQLPEVSKVEIVNIEKEEYTLNGNKDSAAYKVKMKITYRKDLGWQSDIELILIHENNRLAIVEVN